MKTQREMPDTLDPQPPGFGTATEQMLASLWQEALETPDLPSATDDFFSLGGDSMTMVLVEFRIAEEFQVQLPAGAMLRSPTLCELAALVDETRSQAGRTCDRAAATTPP